MKNIYMVNRNKIPAEFFYMSFDICELLCESIS